MSWDVYMMAVTETNVYDRNVTWNNGGIFEKALGFEFRKLNGKSGAEALPLLIHAIVDIAQHKKEYVDLEPDNGWGGIEDALDVLRGLRNSCEEFPNGVIRVS